MRYRYVAQTAERGGLVCTGSESQSSSCRVSLRCPIHCKMGEWVEWSTCTLTCGKGTKVRARETLDWPMYGGVACEGVTNQRLTCNDIPCPGDCVWGSWGQYNT